MFKRFLAVFCAVVLGLSLAGCSVSNNAEQSKTFVANTNNMNIELTCFYIGDKMIRQNVKNTFDYSKLGLKKSDVKAKIDVFSKQYKGIKGIKHTVRITDKLLIENAEVDYTTLDVNKANKIPGVFFDKQAKKGFSMKKAEKALISEGFKEKK